MNTAVKDMQIARDNILALEDAMREMPNAERDKEDSDKLVRHFFAPGVYARELTIPAGVLLTGKIHKTEHLNIISQGVIVVVSPEGRKIIEAPHTMVSKPGAKRVGYALEDTVWTTIHVTEETDLDIIEEQVIAKTFEEVDALLGQDKKAMLESDNIVEIGRSKP